MKNKPDELDKLIEKIKTWGDKKLTKFEKELLALNFTLIRENERLRSSLASAQTVIKFYEAKHEGKN